MRLQIRLAKAGLLMLAFIAATSCGVDKEQTCQIVGLNVSPASATLDHLGDQTTGVSNHAQFAANAVYSGGCVTAACVNCTQGVTWSVSDPANVVLTPVQNQSVVTATCIGPTVGTATITASVPATAGGGKVVTGTASLTCKLSSADQKTRPLSGTQLRFLKRQNLGLPLRSFWETNSFSAHATC